MRSSLIVIITLWLVLAVAVLPIVEGQWGYGGNGGNEGNRGNGGNEGYGGYGGINTFLLYYYILCVI